MTSYFVFLKNKLASTPRLVKAKFLKSCFDRERGAVRISSMPIAAAVVHAQNAASRS
jgi:hypothetical protein